MSGRGTPRAAAGRRATLGVPSGSVPANFRWQRADEHQREGPALSVTIAHRYRGPATSGNGGYTAGMLAMVSGLDAVGSGSDIPYGQSIHAAVRLRTPPPLETPLDLDLEDGRAILRHSAHVIAEATPRELTIAPVPPVSYDEAAAATATYAGHRRHPFPTCFVCGTGREPGDGMRLFPGRIALGRTACPWVPDASVAASGDDEGDHVRPEMLWAALDCPGGWTAEIEGRPMVLGTMTARLDRLPRLGEQCVVTGALLTAEGRRAETATTAYGSDGSVLGLAHAVWIEIDAEAFNRTFGPEI